MNTIVRQICVGSESSQPFYLRIDWAEDLGAGFMVVLCDAVFAWTGEVSEEDVTREAQELKMQRPKYVQELQLALVGGEQQGDFSFQLSWSDAQHQAGHLAYDKLQKDILIRIGSVELQPIPEPMEVIRDFIRHGLERSSELQARSRQLEEENQNLKRELKHITSDLERYVQGKELLEKELYTRFVKVLNEKKAHIRNQQQELKYLREKLEEKQPRSEGPTAARSPSPAEDTYGGSTDEEQGESSHQPPASEQPAHAEGRADHTSFDDSLSDMIDVAPSRKRRQRHLQGPRVEIKTVPREVQHTKRKEDGQGKDPKEKPAEVCAAADRAATDPEVADLFDDF